MPENDVFNKIKDKISNETVLVQTVPSPLYLTLFTQNTSKNVIFITEKNEAFKTKKDLKLISENITDLSLDVTGNPLESPFGPVDLTNISMIEDEENEKEMLFPLPVQEARQILSTCNLMKPNAPVWVLCDGLDRQRIVLLGCNISESCLERSWIVVSGNHTEPNLDAIWKEHMSISRLPENLVKYKFMQSSNSVTVKDKTDPKLVYSSTFVEMHWTKKSITPCIGAGSKAYFNTKCLIGRGNGSSLSYMWSQLVLLQEYLNCVKKKQKDLTPFLGMNLPSSQVVLEFIKDAQGPEESAKPINSQLSDLLHNPLPRKLKELKDVNFIQLVDSILSPCGAHSDLTDQLWNILIGSKTYRELTLFFREIFSDKSKATTYISSRNSSKLAAFLKQKGNINILDPLESLIEIGLEKLKNEVDLIFTRAHIARKASLNSPVLPDFMEATDWIGTAEQWLAWLSRVYCALELLYNADHQLQFGDGLSSVAPVVLQKYVGSESRVEGVSWLLENPKIEIKSLIPNRAQEGVLSWSLQHWTLSLTSERENRRVNSVLYRGVQSPFPRTIFSGDISILDHSSELFSATYHSIADKVL